MKVFRVEFIKTVEWVNKRVREKNYLLDRRLYKSRTLTDWTRLLKAGFIFQHFNIILFYFHTLMIILCFALELEKNEINIFYSKILLCNFLYSRACMTRQRRRKTMKVNIIDCTSHIHTQQLSKNFTQCLFILTIFILNSLKRFIIVGTKINISF